MCRPTIPSKWAGVFRAQSGPHDSKVIGFSAHYGGVAQTRRPTVESRVSGGETVRLIVMATKFT